MNKILELIQQYDAVPSYRDKNGYEISFEAWKEWDTATDKILETINELGHIEFWIPDITHTHGIATDVGTAMDLLRDYTSYHDVQWLLESAHGQYRCAIQILDSPYAPMVETISFSHAYLNLAIIGAITKHQERVKTK